MYPEQLRKLDSVVEILIPHHPTASRSLAVRLAVTRLDLDALRKELTGE
jgi:hypothetical protein